MITFKVNDVKSGKPMRVLEREQAIASLLDRKVEALHASETPLVICDDKNALANAAYHAFYDHYPLVLSPDVVWLTIAQGFATHVNLNAEAMRQRFVPHEGKVTLVTFTPEEFVPGKAFPWSNVVAGFSQQLREHLGKKRDLVVCDFSTTTLNERVASEIVLMNAFQAYFEYLSVGGCGIPEITLLGTAEDWRKIRTRAAALGEFGLEAWAKAVAPILDEIVRTAEGHVDRDFWESFFHWQGGSGPDVVTGWMVTLFPYMLNMKQELVPNPWLDWRALEAGPNFFERLAPGLGDFPGALTSVPVKHVNAISGEEFELSFVGGLFGVTQDPQTLALAPEAGWAIVNNTPRIAPCRFVPGDRVRALAAGERHAAGALGRVLRARRSGNAWYVTVSIEDEDGVELWFEIAEAQLTPAG